MLSNLLTDEQPNIRTQISLTKTIKQALEVKSRLLGESVSQYLRKAAVLRMLTEEDENKDLATLTKNFIGVGKWQKTHPNWKDKKSVRKWHKEIRNDWE